MTIAYANRSFVASLALASLSALTALTGCGGGGGGGSAPAAATSTVDGGAAQSPTAAGPDGIPLPTAATPTFFVAPEGNDATGDGSTAAPFATITKAVNTVPDGSLVLVKAGTYRGRVDLDRKFATGITVRSEQPYLALLRNTDRVVNAWFGQGIALEGFDIAQEGTTGDTVIHIADWARTAGGPNRTRRIALRNNVIHDSAQNDLVKVNTGCTEVTIQGNVFYNQTGADEHIDINGVQDVLVEGNIFFNEDSNDPSTSAFIVVKDSDGIGMERCTIRRNVFLNWKGESTHGFLQFGEDARFPGLYEAKDILVENNFFLGNTQNETRGIVNFQGVRDVVFRHNTIAGHFVTPRSWVRTIKYGDGMPNLNLQFYNNVFSETMAGAMRWFSESPATGLESHVLSANVYWNGGAALPETNPLGTVDMMTVANDAEFLQPGTDPRLPAADGVKLPKWDANAGRFTDDPTDGSKTIAEAFRKIVELYATPAVDTPLIDAARPDQSPADDILGRERRGTADVGCVERP